jgi:hypothetical protein
MKSPGAAMAKKSDNGKKSKVLDLNTKILISIRDELREHKAILQEHTSILQEHTSILNQHSERLTAVEHAVKELARETRRWVAHFDRDYMRLATEFDGIRARVENCEQKLSAR